MILEAGGVVTDFRGEPFDIYKKEILANNGFLQESMVALLTK
jgi:fructose-1,6-bisphosphatase/inositol monophosphatase family enzyme